MRYRKPARPNPQFLYKGFLLVSSGGGYLVYDIGGKQHGSGGTLKEAQQSIDRIVDEKLKRAGSRAGRQAGRKAILDPASWERNPKHGAAFRARMYRLLEIRPDIFEGNQQLRNDFLTRGKTAFTIEDAHRVNKIVQAYMRIRPESLLSRRAGSNPAEKFPSLQRNKTMKLVTGRQYELDTLKLTGWTDGGGAEHEGYNIYDYFRNGIYLGPDDDGIEPLFKRRAGSNPPVEIYESVKEIIAKKGPGHKCDAACKRADHTYRHVFKTAPRLFGNKDGSITGKSKK